MKPIQDSVAVATAARPATGGGMLAGSTGWIALFGLSGAAILVARPSLAVTLAGAVILSAAGVWLARRAASAGDRHRMAARVLSAGLTAALLWLALVAQAGLGLSFATSVALAGGTFLALVAAEAVLAAAATFALARGAGAEPGIPVALFLADRFGGLAGDVK